MKSPKDRQAGAALVRSPVPLYFQVANQLEARISTGEWAAGALLPSEKALASLYGVSLITIRGAMRMLADKGLISRLPGKGTVVRDPHSGVVWELGWLSELISTVMPSRLELRAMGSVNASEWVAQRLGLAHGEPVHFMRTVRFAVQRDDEPFMTTDIYHPIAIGSLLRKSDFATRTAQSKLVIQTVEDRCGVKVSGVRQTMTAELANREDARLLGIPYKHPLLVVTRDYFDANGRLLQTGRSRYRTDHYEYVLNVARSQGRVRSEERQTRASP